MTKQFSIPLAHLDNVKQREIKSLKSYLARFNAELARVTYALDEGVLAHITFGVLSESKLWEELQEKECRTLADFNRKEDKHLRIENSKKALIEP